MEKGMSSQTSAAQHGRIRRKNMNIDQDKLDRLVEHFGARSETEAVDQAIDEVLFRAEMIAGIRAIAGKGGVENYYDDPEL